MRIRFTSPHPKDFPDEVLELIKERRNICNQIHIPAQSGSTAVLKSMRRGYTREAYIELIQHIKQQIPGITNHTARTRSYDISSNNSYCCQGTGKAEKHVVVLSIHSLKLPIGPTLNNHNQESTNCKPDI